MLSALAAAAARRACGGALGCPSGATSAAVTCVQQGLRFAASSVSPADDSDLPSTSYGSDPSDLQQHAAAASGPPRVHQLIGDPRTGVADDTTTNPFGSIEVEHLWHQDSNEVTWYRYTYGAEHMPNMHRDSRLSDHSKNLMYILRAKDPKRWSIEALSRKFGIRRQRVMAILALKEMEAHAIQDGEQLAGPLRPYAFSVDLADVHLDPATGEPVDLGQLVAQQQQQEKQQQQQKQQHEGSGTASAKQQEAASAGGSAAFALGELADFLDIGDAASTSSSSSGLDALSALQAASSSQAADLAHVMPAVAAAAQRLQLQLLQLLRRYDYSCNALREALLGELAKAEAYYNTHIAGTVLEGVVTAPAARPAGAEGGAAEESSAAAAAAEGAESAAESAATAGAAGAFDFEGQRRQIEALVGALRPLLEGEWLREEREAALLAARLRQLLGRHEGGAKRPRATPAAAAAAGAADAAAAGAGSKGGDGAGGEEAAGGQDGVVQELRAACSSADAAVLARAFNALEFGQRRLLLAQAPEARVQLNVRGIDLRAAAEDPSFGKQQPQQQQQQQQQEGPAAASWPGQVPRLVDAFGFHEIPSSTMDALLEAAQQLEDTAQQQSQALGPLAPESSSSAAVPPAGVGDVRALRKALHTYQHTNVAYDEAIEYQAAAAVGAAEPPMLPHSQQRRMLRILTQLDPHALEKLAYWENYEKEVAAGNVQKARRLRAQIQKVLKHLDEESGRVPEFPELPKDDKAETAAQRSSHELLAAFADVDVVGRVYHRGSGERHHVQLPTYPTFEGYSLQEFDRINEGEISMLSHKVAQREDNMMWREFREKLLYNLGLSGPGLWATQNRAKPQRPQEGWSYVVHPTGRSRKQQEPFVAPPEGAPVRPLNEDERLLQQRRTPKPRRRWFFKASA